MTENGDRLIVCLVNLQDIKVFKRKFIVYHLLCSIDFHGFIFKKSEYSVPT